MASGIYDAARESFLKGEIDWATDDIKCVLVDAGDYTADLNSDQFLDDIAAGGRVATSAVFSSKSTTAGVADAADITFSSVTGDQCEALVIYQDTGTETTSRLIALLEDDKVTGLPVTPNGGDITVTWDSGANKIFKL